jgi:hypothetical protein
MTGRDQLNFERVKALIETLHSNGTISDAERDALLDGTSLDRQKETRRRAREGDGPPPWAGPRKDPGQGGGNS